MVQIKGDNQVQRLILPKLFREFATAIAMAAPNLAFFHHFPYKILLFCAYLLQNMDLWITFLSIFCQLSNASEHKS
jgi:hypothetical protein